MKVTSKSDQISRDLKVLSLNVCGLKSKCYSPDFISFLNCYDIVGLQETKLDDLDHLEIPNFVLFFKNRKTISRRKSGGIALAVKTHLVKYVKIIETDCNLVLWFSLDKHLTKLRKDSLYGVVYIPPENSDFSINDPFLEIQTELSKLSD